MMDQSYFELLVRRLSFDVNDLSFCDNLKTPKKKISEKNIFVPWKINGNNLL
jgi:hypothetical protein